MESLTEFKEKMHLNYPREEIEKIDPIKEENVPKSIKKEEEIPEKIKLEIKKEEGVSTSHTTQ